jgi:hypothetical protein
MLREGDITYEIKAGTVALCCKGKNKVYLLTSMHSLPPFYSFVDEVKMHVNFLAFILTD